MTESNEVEKTSNTVENYTLNNPDTLTKYKTAAQISHKVLEAVTGWCLEGTKIIEICQKGDQLLEEEIAKVYKGKKIAKGKFHRCALNVSRVKQKKKQKEKDSISHPTTVSPSSFVTPYTPLVSDTEEANTTLKAGEVVKIQLGAQIDGFGTIVCDSIIVPGKDTPQDVVTGREADLILATYYANELLLRLMVPPGLLASGTEEEKKKAAAEKPPTQAKISSLIEKVAKAYDCNVIENTTSWLFERNEIEGKKKIILSPSGGVKGEGSPEVGEVWGVEVGLSLGSGKVKTLENRPTLHRRTTTTYLLKRPSSRQTLSEIVKKFGTFPFSLRQLDDEKAGKVGLVECVRGGVVRQYEPTGDSDGAPVARLLTTIAITKNGITRLAAPPTLDLSKFKSDKKIEDEEILKILEQPLARSTGSKGKNKKKKKKPKKATQQQQQENEEEEESSDEE
ncbi:Methionyl aminopeptidase [Rasamsonia emersonii CBS 393.64]|uniref:Methionyl aminopeptidase n=1 Tax=Rasamsonia emersonii (strain ATCC 16479 / CBS 393.64 / IMI 116815) TaxID=1408163 RepID=A0A0F4Z106_RASE3|nr:Methionyl aminopeptidase [Rasamsonia emersonii CBS 393.64]KKA24055.1 Methionyl aminopeptidase [Rasamsonia emersonii CBS 393.64]